MGDSPGKRLILFRNSLGLRQRGFAASLGLSDSTIAFIESDSRTPSKRFLLKISDVYGVSADWLLNGHGDMMRPPGSGFTGRSLQVEPPDYARPGHGDVKIGDIEYAFARRMDLSISAGRGIVPVEGSDAESIGLPVAWFERNGLNSDLAVLVQVRGDSMMPSIPDGSLVLLNPVEKAVTAPGIFAFNLDGQSYVKRILPSGFASDGRPHTLLLVSDNPNYPPIALSGAEMNSITIVGRVRAVLTTF